MASLLGKADSTLAQMSYREAMADVAPDLKSVYQDEMKTQALFEKGIKDHFDIVYADANKLGDELKEATQTLAANLGTDTKAMELFNDELNRLRDKSKTFPKGKKGDFERAKLRGTLTKLKESTDGMVQTMYNVKEVVDSDTYNIRATYGDKKKFELLKDIASGSAVMGIDNGEVFWSATGAEGEFKMNRHELAKALVLTDPAVQKATLNTTTTFGAATSEDQKFDFDGALNAYENGFTTKEGLADSMHTKQGSLPYTFHEYLTKGDGAEQLYATLKGMGGFDVSGKDGTPDGRVDRHDFSTGANGIKLAESFDLGGDGYDFQKIRKIVSGFYAEKLAGVDFAENQRLLKEKNRTPEQTVITNNVKRSYADRHYGPKGDTVEGNVLENIYQKFNGGVMTMDDGSVFNRDPKTNAWKNDKTGEIISGNDMIGIAQQSAGGYSLQNDYLFNQFEGTEGSSSGSGGAGGGGVTPVSSDEIDNIVKNIWEPHNVKDFGTGANGAALASYLEKNHTDLLDGVEVRSDGEYIYFKREGESEKRWGGDSTGGKSADTKDVKEIFNYLQSGKTNTETQTKTSTTFDPNENMGEESTTQATTQATSGNNQQTNTFRTSMSKANQGRVNSFNIKGSSGTGRADILKNGRPITDKKNGITVTGVEAVGDKIQVSAKIFGMKQKGSLGEFVQSGGGFKFKPNNQYYNQLEGSNKADFDAFISAVETDPAFAMQVMESVRGENDFNPVDYK